METKQMKLYTEEQINELMIQLQKAFLPENRECDGGYCMGCWKDVVRETLKSMTNLTPIELPSDEEIQKYITSFHYDDIYENLLEHGAKWVINNIKQQVNGE
jgi:hypothetical protein